MPEVYNSSDESVKEADNGLRLTESTRIFFFLVIISANATFFIYWIYKMIDEAANTLRTKFEKIYLYICLCGNKRRLEEQKKQREIKDYNDILKEEFDRSLDEIKNLHSSGKLILDTQNIEKITTYLNTKKFLEAITYQKVKSEYEVKQQNRNKRKAMTNQIFKNTKFDPMNSTVISNDFDDSNKFENSYANAVRVTELKLADEFEDQNDSIPPFKEHTFRISGLSSQGDDIDFISERDADSHLNIHLKDSEDKVKVKESYVPAMEQLNIKNKFKEIFKQCEEIKTPHANPDFTKVLPFEEQKLEDKTELHADAEDIVPQYKQRQELLHHTAQGVNFGYPNIHQKRSEKIHKTNEQLIKEELEQEERKFKRRKKIMKAKIRNKKISHDNLLNDSPVIKRRHKKILTKTKPDILKHLDESMTTLKINRFMDDE